MKDFIFNVVLSITFVLVSISLTVLFVVGLVFLLSKIPVPGSFVYEPDKDCAAAYGKEYHFIDGDRSPDLCVTKDGKVRYYDLIR